jgi:hypothetical protein
MKGSMIRTNLVPDMLEAARYELPAGNRPVGVLYSKRQRVELGGRDTSRLAIFHRPFLKRSQPEITMSTTQPITLFHSPQTRSVGTLALLEELHAPYSIRHLNMKAGEQRNADYLSVNPMGKVPAILHGETLITEQVAIGIYLADLFPEAGITPGIGDALRGPYLRWYVFYAACFEPALIDKALKREPGPTAMVPYGDLATTMDTVISQLSKGLKVRGCWERGLPRPMCSGELQ